MKKTDSTFGWLFAVILLSCLLALSIYLGVTGWYFSSSFSQVGDIVLGNTIDLQINKNSAGGTAFSFSGGYLEGEKLPQIINVRNGDDDTSLYLRAKVYVYMSDNAIANMALVTNENWVYNQEDGYYYFNDKLLPQGKVGLATHVVIGEGSNLSGDKKYIMTVLVESLDGEKDISEYWGYSQIV